MTSSRVSVSVLATALVLTVLAGCQTGTPGSLASGEPSETPSPATPGPSATYAPSKQSLVPDQPMRRGDSGPAVQFQSILDGLLGGARLAHDTDVVLGGQQLVQTPADHLVIVEEIDPDHAVSLRRQIAQR